ncbi:hypothetical protein [Streptomyces griseorubiginosus]
MVTGTRDVRPALETAHRLLGAVPDRARTAD